MNETIHEVRENVRQHYAEAARTASCCGEPVDVEIFGHSLYAEGDRVQVPEAALVASLGCGNPTALADLRPGEVVLDLGSGGGIDVLLSARRVGPDGKAYGLDMTDEMLDLARANQAEAGVDNVEFLKGHIEEIPLPDSSVDVIISNCVVNLSGDKDLVFAEAFRVLRPGGRLAISDVVLSRELPPELDAVTALWTGCITGALTEHACHDGLEAAGFTDITIEPTQVFDQGALQSLAAAVPEAELPPEVDVRAAIHGLDGVIRNAFIRAVKP
jgi:SAM-dependent methyltransferase